MKDWSRLNPKKAEAFDFLGLEDKKNYVDGKACSYLLPLQRVQLSKRICWKGIIFVVKWDDAKYLV